MTSGTLVLGLLNGLIISLLAVGFVLIYKANRFLNLAGAQLGVLSAMLLLKVVNDWGWNWWLSFIGCVSWESLPAWWSSASSSALYGVEPKSPVRLLILSIGVSQVLLGVTYIPGLTPTSQAPFPQPFTSRSDRRRGVERHVGADDGRRPTAPHSSHGLLRVHDVGKQIRAAAGNPDAARLCGISVSRVSLISWGIAGGLSAFAAIFNGAYDCLVQRGGRRSVPVDADDGSSGIWGIRFFSRWLWPAV